MNLLISALVNGGWREEEFSECSANCGPGVRRKHKYCDSPVPSGGELCPCNLHTNETYCTGSVATIEEPCNQGTCEGEFV